MMSHIGQNHMEYKGIVLLNFGPYFSIQTKGKKDMI